MRLRLEGYVLVLQEIKRLWETESIPNELVRIRTVGDIEFICMNSYPKDSYDEDTAEWYIKDCEQRKKRYDRLKITKENLPLIEEFINNNKTESKTSEQRKQEFIKAKINELRGSKIPGFFPTSDELADNLAERLNIQSGMSVHDPNGGIGSLLEAAMRRCDGIEVSCCEINYTLVSILEAKGFNVLAHDMYDPSVKDRFDRIIMNPPFENGQDAEMVYHCFMNKLNEGGVLGAIVSSSALTNTANKFKQFQKLVSENGYSERCPENSFKKSLISTGVNTSIVVLSK